VREGGMGNWGQIPMPANPKIADADLKTVIDWVLAGTPAK
jgi:cytochrome c